MYQEEVYREGQWHVLQNIQIGVYSDTGNKYRHEEYRVFYEGLAIAVSESFASLEAAKDAIPSLKKEKEKKLIQKIETLRRWREAGSPMSASTNREARDKGYPN